MPDDTRKITIEIPDRDYIMIRDYAEAHTRSIGNQARFFLEVGLEVVSQQEAQEQAEAEAAQEKESCIGFQVPTERDCEIDDEELEEELDKQLEDKIKQVLANQLKKGGLLHSLKKNKK